MVFLYIFTNRRELQLFRATKIEDSSSLRLCVSSSMSSSSVHLFIRKQIQEREKKRWGRKRRREYEGIKIQNKRERGGLYCIVMYYIVLKSQDKISFFFPLFTTYSWISFHTHTYTHITQFTHYLSSLSSSRYLFFCVYDHNIHPP